MTPLDLARAVRGFVKTATGLTVIPGNEASPRPATDYATLLLVDDQRKSYPAPVDRADGNVASTSIRRARFSLQFYRDALAKAVQFCAWAESVTGLEEAAKGVFRVVFPLSFRRLDMPVGDKFEERAVVDLGVDYQHILTVNDGVIRTVAVELCYEGHEETIDARR